MYKLSRDGKLLLPSLEYYAAGHCNLRCLGCTQSSPFVEPFFPSIEELEESLAILDGLLHTAKIIILGGEPLLNKNLLQLIEAVKASNIADEIIVATNGLLIKNINPDIWSLIDGLRISIYPNTKKLISKQLPLINDLCISHNVILEIYNNDSFGYTVRSKPHASTAQAQEIFNNCGCRLDTTTLYEGYLYKCSPLAHIDKFLEKFQITSEFSKNDGIKLNKENPDLAADISNYLNSETCLSACTYCNGSSGKKFPHRQLLNSEVRDPTTIELYGA